MTAPAPIRRRSLAALVLLGAALLGAPALASGIGDRIAATGCSPRIAVSNEASRPVQEILVRASGTAAWGADLLGEAVLRPGQTIEIAPTARGPVDVMLLMPDGTARALWRVDACAVRRLALSAALALRAE